MKPVLLWEPGTIEIEAGRTVDYEFKLYKSNKKAATIAVSDVVRFKLSLFPGDATPLLELRSGAVTSNGSTVSVTSVGTDEVSPATVNVRFAQGDTIGLDPKLEYHGELALVDDSDTAPPDAIKRAGHGPVTVKAAPGGNVGLTP